MGESGLLSPGRMTPASSTSSSVCGERASRILIISLHCKRRIEGRNIQVRTLALTCTRTTLLRHLTIKIIVLKTKHILVHCTSRLLYITFTVHHVYCTSRLLYITFTVHHVYCTSRLLYITFTVHHVYSRRYTTGKRIHTL